jgi:TRAP-type C4-dicarboxylate transport system permease small subunit
LYVVLAFATAFLYIPQLGISGSHGMTGSGLWEKQPYRPLAFGFIYFLFQALVRLARPALDARKAEKEKRKERYG